MEKLKNLYRILEEHILTTGKEQENSSTLLMSFFGELFFYILMKSELRYVY